MMPAGVIPSEEQFTKPPAHTDVSMFRLLFAEQLFNAVDKGTPVVAYYREAVTLTNNAAKMSNAYSYVAPDAAQ